MRGCPPFQPLLLPYLGLSLPLFGPVEALFVPFGRDSNVKPEGCQRPLLGLYPLASLGSSEPIGASRCLFHNLCEGTASSSSECLHPVTSPGGGG